MRSLNFKHGRGRLVSRKGKQEYAVTFSFKIITDKLRPSASRPARADVQARGTVRPADGLFLPFGDFDLYPDAGVESMHVRNVGGVWLLVL